jgi:hypothetical protein
LPKISAGHAWSWKIFFANFQILGPLGCQGWVVMPQNVKKSQNHCTLLLALELASNPVPLLANIGRASTWFAKRRRTQREEGRFPVSIVAVSTGGGGGGWSQFQSRQKTRVFSLLCFLLGSYARSGVWNALQDKNLLCRESEDFWWSFGMGQTLICKQLVF